MKTNQKLAYAITAVLGGCASGGNPNQKARAKKDRQVSSHRFKGSTTAFPMP